MLPSVKPIENSNLRDWRLSDWNCTRRIFGQIRLKEKTPIDAETWRGETESSNNVAQELAKKLRNYEGSVAKKQMEPRQLRIDELSVHQERNPTTVSQLS